MEENKTEKEKPFYYVISDRELKKISKQMAKSKNKILFIEFIEVANHPKQLDIIEIL